MSWINWYFGLVDAVLLGRRLEAEAIIKETYDRQHMSVEQSASIPPDYDETQDDGPRLLTESEIMMIEALRSKSLIEQRTKQMSSLPVGRPQKIRVPIPKIVKVELVRERGGMCQHCGNEIFQQYHHVDGNPANNAKDNLMLVCYDCHKSIERYRR
jgi:hypothetical protein